MQSISGVAVEGGQLGPVPILAADPSWDLRKNVKKFSGDGGEEEFWMIGAGGCNVWNFFVMNVLTNVFVCTLLTGKCLNPGYATLNYSNNYKSRCLLKMKLCTMT